MTESAQAVSAVGNDDEAASTKPRSSRVKPDDRAIAVVVAPSLDEPAPPPIQLDAPEWYLNRELTWLAFNRRVLH